MKCTGSRQICAPTRKKLEGFCYNVSQAPPSVLLLAVYGKAGRAWYLFFNQPTAHSTLGVAPPH